MRRCGDGGTQAAPANDRTYAAASLQRCLQVRDRDADVTTLKPGKPLETSVQLRGKPVTRQGSPYGPEILEVNLPWIDAGLITDLLAQGGTGLTAWASGTTVENLAAGATADETSAYHDSTPTAFLVFPTVDRAQAAASTLSEKTVMKALRDGARSYNRSQEAATRDALYQTPAGGWSPPPDRGVVLSAIERAGGPVVRREGNLLVMMLTKVQGPRGETVDRCLQDAAP
jgi:hypothetical protein